MGFTTMRDNLIKHFEEMTKEIGYLFEVDVDKDELWNLYLDSFEPKHNPVYRERRVHDCSCCRQFIKHIGNAVVLKDGVVKTIWDFETSEEFKPVMKSLSEFIKSKPITNVYVSNEATVGCKANYEELDNGEVKTWTHFYLKLPQKFVNQTHRSIGDVKGQFRDTRNVFKRSLDEISEESILTILELINSNTLYKGEEWKNVLNRFLQYKQTYDKLPTAEAKELYAWEYSLEAGMAIGRIRNHSIGTLLVNVSEGMDLNEAVKQYEIIVAPANYKRPKEIYTKKMLEDAKNTITELGYFDALGRRYATLDDITVNNILFSNKDSAKRISGADDVFSEMEKSATSTPKKFDKVEEVPIDKFVKDILPTATELELYLENRHSGNMVSLIAPKNKDAKTMFKWNNGFSWAYSGNVTDSMKERVKAAGGKVDGDLRFSIQWNDGSSYNGNDFDAHCIEPDGYEIYYGNRSVTSPSKGTLDVDIVHPNRDVPAVENIAYASRRTMKDGTYTFFVNCFSDRGGRDGFRAEIEFDGQIYSFEYPHSVSTDKNIRVAEVTLKNGVFTIHEKLPSSVSSKEVWNVKTNNFVPVSVVMYSPNYWDEQDGIGHRHFFFMLKDCINTESPNGFYNEFLKNELTEHKRVLAALGSKMRVEDVEDQLSGVGFSATKRDDVVVKVKGNTERVLKIKF